MIITIWEPGLKPHEYSGQEYLEKVYKSFGTTPAKTQEKPQPTKETLKTSAQTRKFLLRPKPRKNQKLPKVMRQRVLR